MEPKRAVTWVLNRLRADTSGPTSLTGLGCTGVYEAGFLPAAGVAYPFLVVQDTMSRDVKTRDGTVIFVWVHVMAKVYGRGTPRVVMEAIMERVDSLLDKQTVTLPATLPATATLPAADILAVWRDRHVPLPPEEEGGVVFPVMATIYNVQVREAA